jgi:hypothetical protein
MRHRLETVSIGGAEFVDEIDYPPEFVGIQRNFVGADVELRELRNVVDFFLA